MRFGKNKTLRAGRGLVLWMAMGWMGALSGISTGAMQAWAQAVTTTTVQGTVYLANGAPAAGMMQLKWPAFTTSAGQAVAAGSLSVPIGADGFVSVNLAPNAGATPAGLFYTVVYNLSDGSANMEYWTVPAAAQATIGQVRAQVMPAAQAVQTVSKAYVDLAIQELQQGMLGPVGGTLTGPLYLNGDPVAATQAADKHYVDDLFAQAIPLSGGAATGPLTATQLGAVYEVDQFAGADFGAKLQACVNALNATYGGTCDARNFAGSLSMASSVTIATANVTVDLPCSTIATSKQIVVTAGTRNVTLHGCALRGASAASGSEGGTVLYYSGAGAMVQVGDSTYAVDTPGFALDDVVINTTASTAATAQAIVAYRTQELALNHLYLLGNANQTGITLDGTGNYTGGSLEDDEIGGFLIALNGIGHQVANSATTDWVNATTFLRLHVDCPTSSGAAIAGTVGINLAQGDGNTFIGGDVEGCSTMLHLGPNAQNNTLVGVRNENSTTQVQADAGSQYNSWITGGTMFTGKLVDNGTHNSFWDAFHRGYNGVNGDVWRSQMDGTVTDHEYLGIGLGNVRGRETEYVTDVPGSAGNYQNAWLVGLTDGAAGAQNYQIEDLLNNVNRISIGQYNNGSSTNNQTVINAAGTGAVVLNGSNGAGTGGVVIGSGGAANATVATISNAGNAQFVGALQVGGTAQSTGTMTVKNGADAEVDYYLWPGATTSQKGSFTYKDWNGNSQWYMVKDASNNWALNSAVGNLDSFKAYQSTNSGDTYVNASNSSGHIRLNYESGSGVETDIYSNGTLDAAFLGPTSIKFPGLAASSGTYCLQVDDSGYVTNTGASCGSGSGSASGTVTSGDVGEIAYYTANGTVVGGINSVPMANGGTGATTAAAALTNLGAQAVMPGVSADGSNGVQVTGNVTTGGVLKFADGSVQTTSASQVVSVVSSSTTINLPTANNVISVVNLTKAAASSVSLPASSSFPNCPSVTCPVYQVKDGAGDSATYPITVVAADGKLIDGQSSLIIQANYGSVRLVFNGTQWNVI